MPSIEVDDDRSFRELSYGTKAVVSGFAGHVGKRIFIVFAVPC